VLALEAEVLRDDSNSDAWHLLGVTHAENDDDRQVRTPCVVFPCCTRPGAQNALCSDTLRLSFLGARAEVAGLSRDVYGQQTPRA